MKTTEFRCGECGKLLAKFTGDLCFKDSDRIDDDKYYIEIKCLRCKHVTTREITGYRNISGMEIFGEMDVHSPKPNISYDSESNTITVSGGELVTMWDVIVHMAKRDVNFEALKKQIDAEALEAHKRVPRHGDNVRR